MNWKYWCIKNSLKFVRYSLIKSLSESVFQFISPTITLQSALRFAASLRNVLISNTSNSATAKGLYTAVITIVVPLLFSLDSIALHCDIVTIMTVTDILFYINYNPIVLVNIALIICNAISINIKHIIIQRLSVKIMQSKLFSICDNQTVRSYKFFTIDLKF